MKLITIVLILAFIANNQPSTATAVPALSVSSVQKLGTSSIEFGLNLYNELRKDTSVKNMFFSPASISLGLSMILLGAKGVTADEIVETLRFTSYRDQVHSNSEALLDIINAAENPYELSSANRIYGIKNYKLVEDFLTSTGRYYQASLERLDFADSEAARQVINNWVADQTNQKIKDLIPPGILGPTTVMVLVNAIYFHANWMYEFDKAKTKNLTFYSLGEKAVLTKMMTMDDIYLEETKFNYTHNTDLKAQILELPYKGWDVNVYIFLPDERDGLPQMENKLTAQMMDNVIDKQLRARSLKMGSIHLPKFKMDFHAELIPFLRTMGIDQLFESADLSGIGGNPGDLFVSNVIHKAFVDVNEEGTEAAAATVEFINESAVENPITFHADHPFLFLIRQRSTKSTLFMGRLMETAPNGYSQSQFISGGETYHPRGGNAAHEEL